MKNLLLDGRTARDIEDRVARIHRDLDYRGGKVELSDVRALMSLDLAYYAADDAGLLSEVVHKLTIGAKQVIKRPLLLIEAVRKLELKALFVPDRKQILIDASLPDPKKRWSEGHEILHSVLPWHSAYMLGDTKITLTPGCHDRIEAEANFGTGRLFFPKAEFEPVLRSAPMSMQRVRQIASHFGNTITSTLWRCVEFDDQPSFAVIGAHPNRPQPGTPDVEHIVQSPAFAQRFSKFSPQDATGLIKSYCGYQRTGPLGMAEVMVLDDDGQAHAFVAETFCNGYNTLTLAQYRGPKSPQITKPETPLILLPGS
ncbi:ImmA/IrrE family metallo-endopeptidase [Lysobacter solisilvae (ex Woo and Kim 2020)]|uniref:ImmA/IrrE family metallo-endopeptidase n=1 Tax=Agrilutibacter terrestris TaxID=2865112 RepID=A0A7H0G0A8_9GAMM|nr:hypothetical protein [Lysobacter terrestris]QNP41724.1 hypothetical protein H8B22_05820 [Lysobacter terrestris]